MAKCRSCGAEIVWIKTAGGKSMPCNFGHVYYIESAKAGSKRIVTKNGEVLACEYTDDPYEATGVGYIPHWSTCNHGEQFRKQHRRNNSD